MTISDEIRKWCDEANYIDKDERDELRELADRIDDEMVKLPKDRDGEVIHIGDEVYTPMGSKAFVIGIRFLEHMTFVKVRTSKAEEDLEFYSAYIFHTSPDSLERIADELEAAVKWCDKEGNYGTGASSVSESTLHTWATRIRKLAKEGE